MFEVTRYEARKRLRGTVILVVVLGLFALLVLSIFPSIEAAGAEFEATQEDLPEAFQAPEIGTVEGYLASQFYEFVWVLLLGVYVAYAAGGLVAPDRETGRLDLVLATPVSRSRLVVEKFLSLFVPLALLNAVVPLFVYGGVMAVDASIDVGLLLVVHLLSLPYLLACASVGFLLSVLAGRGDTAQRGALAGVFLLFIVDAVSLDTDFEWLGTLSPTRYYEPTEILVEETYDVESALLLLVAAFLLFALARLAFRRQDV